METNNNYIIYQRGMNYSLLPYSRTMHHMVRLRVTYNGKRIDIRTGIRVEPRFWDKSRGL